MKYMLLIYSAESSWSTAEWNACVAKSTGVCQEMAEKGQFISAAPLFPAASGATVRVRNGQQLVTTGPFAETTEQLGGYYLIDVPNLDEAISIAARLPPAARGTVEIRPVFELSSLPPDREEHPEDSSATDTAKYMFLCYDNEQHWAAAGKDAHLNAMQKAVELTHELDSKGMYIKASPLHPSSMATSVRVRNERRLVTDGPFAETREVLGGFYLLRAKSRAELLAYAVRHPGVFVGSVEIRQVFDPHETPTADPCEIVSFRNFPFTADEIFAAYSDPKKLARWWGPEGFRNTFETFDFCEGGEWKFVMHGPDGKDYQNLSYFRKVSRNCIELEHQSPPWFNMTMTLTELPGFQTRLVWRMKFESESVRDRIAQLTEGCNDQNFDRLTEVLNEKR
ncbi:MAG: SRPBCC domain-containing protein [Planctomyces sp.]|nr:SRPBCC domain-containing protein [Planctomyces sp.]